MEIEERIQLYKNKIRTAPYPAPYLKAIRDLGKERDKQNATKEKRNIHKNL